MKNAAGIKFFGVLAIILLAIPYVFPRDFAINVVTQILIYSIMGLSLNMMVGLGGMISLGHAAYVGIAGYACILLSEHGFHPVVAAFAAISFSTLCAGGFGLLVLRLHGLSFLMATLAIGQIIWGIAYRANALTGGDNGLILEARPRVLGFDIQSASAFYYFTLIIFALSAYGMWRFANSPLGAAAKGTKDQPRRMRALGYNGLLIRWLVFVISGFWCSVGGVMFVYYNQFLSPHGITLQQSAELLLMIILGGTTSFVGPVIGAAIVTVVKLVVSTYVERWNMLLGLTFIFSVMMMPLGIVPGLDKLWRRVADKIRSRRSLMTGNE